MYYIWRKMYIFAADMENRIKEIIREKGYTMKEFADVLGITRQTLHSIIKDPSSPTLERLSDALGVPVWQFFASPDEVRTLVCPHCGKKINIKIE